MYSKWEHEPAASKSNGGVFFLTTTQHKGSVNLPTVLRRSQRQMQSHLFIISSSLQSHFPADILYPPKSLKNYYLYSWDFYWEPLRPGNILFPWLCFGSKVTIVMIREHSQGENTQNTASLYPQGFLIPELTRTFWLQILAVRHLCIRDEKTNCKIEGFSNRYKDRVKQQWDRQRSEAHNLSWHLATQWQPVRSSFYTETRQA